MLKSSLSQNARRLFLSINSARLRGTDSVLFRDDYPEISPINTSNPTPSGSVQSLKVLLVNLVIHLVCSLSM